MSHLYDELNKLRVQWAQDSYQCDEYPAIGEILQFQFNDETLNSRFLRKAQIRALEIYWYLRLVKQTAHIFDLYKEYYPKKKDLIKALGIPDAAFEAVDFELDELIARIKTDDRFVKDFKLESVRETLILDYPSYIMALAMGAGKTILIGAIIATEFAMALEYPDGPFVENALVFAPGKTIIESLRELAAVPYDLILPARMHKVFAASVKLTFTRDGEKDIPVIRRSSFNVVVTNTEKIRIQKESVRKTDLGALFSVAREDEARQEVANLRLQAIASLPHLAVFSDEAHHTYGQALDTELKKVRKTVDYLAQNTNLICVVNTTGTPYYQRQALKDVVIWYGLSEGIKDSILKDLAGNIKAYDFDGNAEHYIEHVVRDFFTEYGDVRLPDGAPARLAIYFPQTDDLKDLKPVIDRTLMTIGLSPTICLVNTSDNSITQKADIDAFNHLNDPTSPHRVMLLVNKGTEGWNCPSLFACALARKLKTSNNFVLQASTRCLRQVHGNEQKARVYLSNDNFAILDRQLQETFGETINDLNRTGHETCTDKIVVRKLDIPPLMVIRTLRTVFRKEGSFSSLCLRKPQNGDADSIVERTYTVAEQLSSYGVLKQQGDSVKIETSLDTNDAYAAAVELAACYRIDIEMIYVELRRLYQNEDIPVAHMGDLRRQIEEQTRFYEIKEEKVEHALALIKPDGFIKETDATGTEVYTAEIVYPKDRESLIARFDKWKGTAGPFGFHYSPYNFDSSPEMSFFEQMLAHLNTRPDEIEDIYFTGALTDPGKTDFFVEYKDDKGKWRKYTPDFVIRKKKEYGAKTLIVEVKRERDREHPIDGETGRKAMAVRKWEDLNPDRLKYEMIFTDTDAVSADKITPARKIIGV